MNLRTLFETISAEDKRRLAARADTKLSYLYQVSTDQRVPSAKLARRLVEADSRLTLAELRPDIWGDQQAAA